MLLFVLGAIALTSLLLIALLGLSLASARLAAAQRDAAQERRAAEGAIEAAIAQLGNADGAGPCDAVPVPGAALHFEPEAVNGGVQVELACESGPSPVPSTPTSGSDQPTLVSTSPVLNADTGLHRFPTVDMGTFNCVALNVCDNTRTITTTWASEGDAPLVSVQFLFRSFEGENVHNLNRDLRLTVSAPGAGGSCTHEVPGGRSNLWAEVYTAVDLLESPACRTLLEGKPRSALHDAQVQLRHVYRTPSYSGCAPACSARLTVGESRLLLDALPLEATSAAGWSNAASALTLDGSSASVSQPNNCREDSVLASLPALERLIAQVLIAEARCRFATAGEEHALTVSGFQPAGAGLDEAEQIDQALVTLEPVAGSNALPRSWISDPIDNTWFTVVLETAGGSCTVSPDGGFARSNAPLVVDLLVNPECRALVQSVGDLEGASITYRVRSDCLHYSTTRAPEDASGRCNSVRLPDFDRVALLVTPVQRESLVTLTASVDDTPIAQADVLFDSRLASPREVPVVSWRYDDLNVVAPPVSTP